MKHTVLFASVGLTAGMVGILGALPAQAQSGSTTYNYVTSIKGELDVSAAFSGPLGLPTGITAFDAVFRGEVEVEDASFLDGTLSATVPELFDLSGIPLTEDLENKIGLALGLINPTRYSVVFTSSGFGTISSSNTLLSRYELSVNTSPQVLDRVSLVANLEAPQELTTCVVKTCHSQASFEALLTLIVDDSFTIELAALNASLGFETTPHLSPVPDPTSVPEPAAVLGLIGLGGWLMSNDRRQKRVAV